eukprot:COSAG02_NODE_214_length_28689_cov_34.895523_19_plen_72_part_00
MGECGKARGGGREVVGAGGNRDSTYSAGAIALGGASFVALRCSMRRSSPENSPLSSELSGCLLHHIGYTLL